MCGVVAYIGSKECLPILMEGLSRVEYRGYDSAGVVVHGKKGLTVVKRKGKLRELENALPKTMAGTLGIGHTRWATHGEPNDANAHPHLDATGTVAVVHNGIVENASELRAKLEADGVVFASETDTECLAHLIGRRRATGLSLEESVRMSLAEVEGTYGLVVIDSTQPDRIVAARNGSPVIIGIGEGEMLIGSDVSAMVRHTSSVVPLDDGELAVLTADGYRTMALDATPTQKRPFDVNWSIEQIDRGGFAHFMAKEIHEQPAAIERALRGRLDERFATVKFGGINLTAREVLDIRRVKILGCGSAYGAGMAGAQLIETLARIPADAESASEFRYRNPVIEPDVLYIAMSQSGETADTLAAVTEIKRKGGRVLAVVNVVGSTIARECDGIYLHAGPEVSVASTKVVTSMVVSLGMLATFLGRVRDLGPSDGTRLISGLKALPSLVQGVLDLEPHIAAIAAKYAHVPSMFFIGRNTGYPIALEGSLKLKEISYIHAEAYPASELKHGPLALVGPEFPVVSIALDDPLVEKNVSSVQQVRARKGPTIGVVQKRGRELHDAHEGGLFDDLIEVPASEPEWAPLLASVALQLLAYHAAIALGRDVDQPRNLAKSVTVE
jgi:glutamine---fructose-6-phosphate transaminase (isomerizing)